MRLIIAGSRCLSPTIAQISSLIDELPTLVICGCADGVDRAGYAFARHFSVPVEFFPAWPFQKAWALEHANRDELIHACPAQRTANAGHIRNAAMSKRAESVLILHDGVSTGSLSMKEIAERAQLPVKLKVFTNNEKGVCVGPLY